VRTKKVKTTVRIEERETDVVGNMIVANYCRNRNGGSRSSKHWWA